VLDQQAIVGRIDMRPEGDGDREWRRPRADLARETGCQRAKQRRDTRLKRRTPSLRHTVDQLLGQHR
jgi:hypothetical protein